MTSLGAVRLAAVLMSAAAGTSLAGCRSARPEPAAEPAPARGGPGAPADSGDQVSVGYGTQRREQVSGSVSSVANDDVDSQRVQRVEQLLQGRVAGVQVVRTASGGYSVRIRGAGSLQGDGEPLFVLDGTPLMRGVTLGDALAGISPSEIARIDVLKDAGSTAIYGSQGGNGVVLIKTKRR